MASLLPQIVVPPGDKPAAQDRQHGHAHQEQRPGSRFRRNGGQRDGGIADRIIDLEYIGPEKEVAAFRQLNAVIRKEIGTGTEPRCHALDVGDQGELGSDGKLLAGGGQVDQIQVRVIERQESRDGNQIALADGGV